MRITFLTFILCGAFFFISCKKEVSKKSTHTGTLLKNSLGECMPINVAGTYTAGVKLIASNYMEVTVTYDRGGAYRVSTDTVNDFYFRGQGVVDSGTSVIKLKGYGTPSLNETDIFTVTVDASSCEADVSVH